MNKKMKYVCLLCENEERIETTKETYQKVHVCPQCNGALVDLWLVGKYSEKPKAIKESVVLQLIDKGILTVNEVRKHYGFDPIPNGNERYIKP